LDLTGIPDDPDEQLSTEDKLLEAAIAICYYCLKRRIPVTLRSGEWVHSGASEPDFDSIYRALAEVEFSSKTTLEELITQENPVSPLNFIIITPYITKKLVNELSGYLRIGHNLIVVYIPVKEDKETYPMLLETGAKVFRVGKSEDILDVFK
jgi:hypothetical protein